MTPTANKYSAQTAVADSLNTVLLPRVENLRERSGVAGRVGTPPIADSIIREEATC